MILSQKKLCAWSIWFLASLFYLYEVVLRVTPNTMTRELMSHFNIGSMTLGLMVSAYYYAYVPLQIPCGLIVDRFGPKWVLVVSSIFSAFGMLLFSSSTVLFSAVISRFFVGAGAACAFISCMKIISAWFPRSKFGYISGLTNIMGTIGGLSAGLPLAYLIRNVGWSQTSFYMGAMGVFIAVLIGIFLRNKKEQFLDRDEEERLFLPTLKAFIRDPNMWLIGLSSSFMYLPITVFAELWGTPFLQGTYFVSKEVAAGLSVVVFFGAMMGSIAMPGFANRSKSYLKVMKTTALLGALLFFVISYARYISYPYMYFIIFMAGFVTAGQVLSFSWVNDYCGERYIGLGIGFCNALTMVSGIIFQPLLGYILDFFWEGQLIDGVRIYSVIAYSKAILLIPFCFVLGYFALSGIKESHYLSKD